MLVHGAGCRLFLLLCRLFDAVFLSVYLMVCVCVANRFVLFLPMYLLGWIKQQRRLLVPLLSGFPFPRVARQQWDCLQAVVRLLPNHRTGMLPRAVSAALEVDIHVGRYRRFSTVAFFAAKEDRNCFLCGTATPALSARGV